MKRRPIRGLENYFSVSEDGVVYSTRSGVLKQHVWGGYMSTALHVTDGEFFFHKTMYVHRLVAQEFCSGRTRRKRFVNHKDGNKHNNHYSNLEWVTERENKLHAYANGLTAHPPGSVKYPRATVEKVIELRKKGLTFREIENLTGVSNSYASQLINGRRRQHDEHRKHQKHAIHKMRQLQATH
jgi:hypothetical protein